MENKKGLIIFITLILLNFYEFAYCDFSRNIRISFDPEVRIQKLALIEKDENDTWRFLTFLDEPIKRENEKHELLIVNINKELESIYIQPFFEKDDSWTYTGDLYFRCKVGSKAESKFTPCNSKFTRFVSTEFFFLAGTTRYMISKSAISNALEESKLIPELLKTIDLSVIDTKDEKEYAKTFSEERKLPLPVPEFDGVYILTVDNQLIEVPASNYDSLLFRDEISSKMDKLLTGGAIKFSVTFTTEQFHHISANKIKGIIVKGLNANNIELRNAIREQKLFSSSFSNDFRFYPDEVFSLSEFKRKTLNNEAVFYEPISKRLLGNMDKGIYLLISHKNRDITWSSLCPSRRKGMLGFAHDKPMLWLIGVY